MPAVVRIGDADTGDGNVLGTPQSTVFANNILVAVDGSQVSGHGEGEHADPRTANGSPNVFINFIPVNRVGDADTCGDTRVDGSSDVFVN